MLAVDTSGSMVSCTNPSVGYLYDPPASTKSCPSTATKNSCNLEPTRLNDAKCAVGNTIKAFGGEVNFGLMTYARKLAGCTAGACTDTCTATDGTCNPSLGANLAGPEIYTGKSCTISDFTNGDSCGNKPDCATTNYAPFGDNWLNGGNVVVDMLKDPTWAPGSQPTDNTSELLKWVDGQCDNSKELFAAGFTPLEGMLRSAEQYYLNGWSSGWADGNYCASGGPAIDHPTPVDQANDRICRKLNVILVTDGDETCGGAPANAAAELYNTGIVIQGTLVHIRTWVIGFAGASAGQLNPIADRGDDGLLNGSKTALFANNEVELAQALSTIISGSVSPETCNNADDNCNGCIDEGSKLYCDHNKTPQTLAYLTNNANTRNLTMCCQWTPQPPPNVYSQRDACMTAYLSSVTGAKPKGDQWLLPCWDPATDSSNPEFKWLCYDPGETCDNKDNNCDVTIDPLSGSYSTNTVDENQLKCADKTGTMHCPVPETCNKEDDDCDLITDNASGSPQPYSVCPNQCQPKGEELCNGCDDDCDGIADNGQPSIACGFSPPANCAGVRTCTPVAVTNPGDCIPGYTYPGASRYGACSSSPAANDATCNGQDDDCDGVVDEDAQPVTCTNGQPSLVYKDVNALSQCVKGLQPCGTATCIGWIGPTQEVCDGIDNDCDGLVDAADSDLIGVNADCGSVTGICTKGKTACVGGAIICQGGTQPQPEICDGVDNNCNGQTDEAPLTDGPTNPGCWQNAGTTCTFKTLKWNPPTGATCSGLGTLTSPCQAGALVCQGASGWACVGGQLPSAEVCDGQDNNCNGTSDENNPGGGGVCGTTTGECDTGTFQCQSGKLTCVGGQGPVQEVCDTKDNDCDGQTDEKSDIPGIGQTCGSNIGTCKSGTVDCVAGQTVCTGETKPGTEICDGKDNDCDGAIDDTPSDTPANLGCWQVAGTACSGGGKTWGIPAGATCTGVGSLTAPCSAGTLVCSGTSGWVCQGGVLPGTEVCDGQDNDCDGTPDDGNPGGGGQCGTSPNILPCKKGTFSCVSGQLICQGEIAPTPELCDNIDNDCDGIKDNNIASGIGQPCGSSTGLCKKGLTACVSGAVVCQGETKPASEVCDGSDNDCDGTVDNNLTDGPANPNCWNNPGSGCTFKNVSWSPPANATCTTTGTLTTPCSTGKLTCTGTGWACVGGLLPTAEICDGIDNDCDGTPDDGNPGGGVTCGNNTGLCTFGTLSCVSGNLQCQGGQQPSVEVCDGKDNDCDGQTDEASDLIGMGQTCGSSVGTCQTGKTACVNGAVVCQNEVKPGVEICDGKDNDCNGAIDDKPTDGPTDPGCWTLQGTTCSFKNVTWSAPPGATCTTKGTLSSPCLAGAIICQNGGWVCLGDRQPEATDVCDNIDNDCNGTVDQGDPGGGGPCGNPQIGECRPGKLHCVTGQILCTGEIGPTPELCDNKDNDCDGTTDNNVPGTGRACNQVGECTGGLTACVGGALICSGGIQPVPEICDGKDNDCNGITDDGTLDDTPADPDCWNVAGTTCSYKNATWDPPPGGSCYDLSPLTAPCQTGKLRCDGVKGWQCIGGKLPVTEICDGQDQDCDGVPDNGNLTNGTCSTDVGECTIGTQRCVDGTFKCDGVLPDTEVCDGKDNDCNGENDNGIPTGASCPMVFDTSKFPGDRNHPLCRPGRLQCDTIGGKLTCVGGQAPQAEICDGLDNDCDGTVDETGPAPDGMDGTTDPADSTHVIGGACGSDVGICKQGAWGCVGGQFVCVGGVTPQREVCDCQDNDCDGKVDEDPDAGSTATPPCGAGTTCVVANGACQCAESCSSSEFQDCPLGTTCDLVPVSSDPTKKKNSCVANPCPNDCKDAVVDGECGPAGTLDADGVALPECSCKGSAGCHGPCFNLACASGQSCVPTGDFAGQCRPNGDCRFFGCTPDKACSGGVCVDNPCEPNPCGAGEVCKPTPTFDGNKCTGSCADVTCGAGEICVGGTCTATGCGVDCTGGEVCGTVGADGGKSCVANPCIKSDGSPLCNDGSYCDPTVGACGGDDPCAGVGCPTGQVCVAGECYKPSVNPGTGGAGGASGSGGQTAAGGTSAGGAGQDASAGGSGTNGGQGGAAGGGGKSNAGSGNEPDEVIGLATGGGGCRCDLARGDSSRGALGLGTLLMMVFATRRRARKEGGAR